ncbi:RNA polymerase sigma factor [Demequina muriae]|uniref:RNA polymerase sigma factor n=1 Tax=Demequina muriae TaxID=3051664 RepID=A0ABT8GH18_9MICO|nr:RNA polymerase sigma factor [Demequina sp. EGI L300058]MDN4480241.1 RNA polymerase sigma factor [Demequina sp. EGI L300058]
MTTTQDELAAVFRRESGRAVATLVRMLGDIDAAEEAVQDAFVRALEHWPRDGIPPSPAAWIVATAKNRAIDVVRRESTREERYRRRAVLTGDDGTQADPASAVAERLDESVADDQLRLIFTCCHPALGMEARVALTLRLIAGLETRDIARAFLVPEATMAQRLTRAKRKIATARIPYRVPPSEELPARLEAVLAVLYLVFNEGYSGTTDATRPDLAREATRLTRELHRLLPEEPEASGLLALMLLTESRRPARFDGDGHVVLLESQDRSRWDAGLIEEGQAVVLDCLRRGRPGPYQVQAAIAAVHSDATRFEDTDWRQILTLYDQLFALHPTAVVELNRAVALAEVRGPGAALAVVDGLPLERYHLWHATRANLLNRLGRTADARAAYATAAEFTENPAERAFLLERAERG